MTENFPYLDLGVWHVSLPLTIEGSDRIQYSKVRYCKKTRFKSSTMSSGGVEEADQLVKKNPRTNCAPVQRCENCRCGRCKSSKPTAVFRVSENSLLKFIPLGKQCGRVLRVRIQSSSPPIN